MIVRKTHEDHIHIYSDKGLKIRQVQTQRIYKEARELIDGIHYEYEEVEVSTNG